MCLVEACEHGCGKFTRYVPDQGTPVQLIFKVSGHCLALDGTASAEKATRIPGWGLISFKMHHSGNRSGRPLETRSFNTLRRWAIGDAQAQSTMAVCPQKNSLRGIIIHNTDTST